MSIEIDQKQADWQEKRRLLISSEFNQADEELARLLYFGNNDPIISGILHSLRQSPAYLDLDVSSWIKEHNRYINSNLGFSLDETERCAQCLRILDWVSNNHDGEKTGLWNLGTCTYIGSSTKLIDFIHSALDVFFEPIYAYVCSQLRKLKSIVTPSDIDMEIRSNIDSETSFRYPEINKLLSDTYKLIFSLATESSGNSWFQVGYSCRTILIKFADVIFKSEYVPQNIEQPKKDDADTKLKFTCRAMLKSLRYGDRYRESIEKVITANWDYISSVGHRGEKVTEKNAKFALLYTYMTLSIIIDLIDEYEEITM